MQTDDVLALRLATQRLAGPPWESAVAAVRGLLAVQAQDAPLARASVAARCDGHADDVRAAVDAGALVRTHVLRPTWHLVAAEDLGWLLDLTSPKVARGLAGRHRQLGLDDATTAGAREAFARALADGPLARPALQRALLQGGVLGECSLVGQQVGHLLLLAELEGLVVSGPVTDAGLGGHTYVLGADRLPPSAPRDRDEALAELVGRFVAGHGPVSLADLQRWTAVTLTEARAALASLGDAVASVTVEGADLFYDVAVADAADAHRDAARAATLLLPVFDEAFLSYHDVEFPRAPGHPMADAAHRFAETGGGVVISGLVDIGTWSRTHTDRGFDVTLRLATSVSDAVRAAAHHAAAVFGRRCVPDGTPVRVVG